MHFLCIFILIALSRCHELKDTKPIIKDTPLNYSFVGVIIAGNKNLHLYLFLRLYNCIIQSFRPQPGSPDRLSSATTIVCPEFIWMRKLISSMLIFFSTLNIYFGFFLDFLKGDPKIRVSLKAKIN